MEETQPPVSKKWRFEGQEESYVGVHFGIQAFQSKDEYARVALSSLNLGKCQLKRSCMETTQKFGWKSLLFGRSHHYSACFNRLDSSSLRYKDYKTRYCVF